MTGEKPVTEQYLPKALLITQDKVKVTEKSIVVTRIFYGFVVQVSVALGRWEVFERLEVL